MFYFLTNNNINSPLLLLAIFIAYAIAICFAISFHEFAHGYSAYKFGDITAKTQGRLSLNPFKHLDMIGVICFLFIGFGWAKPVQINPLKVKNYKLGMSVISLAGIFTNFVLAFIFSAFLFYFDFLLASTNLFLNFLYFIFYFSTFVNIALAIFNLLPIYPLDGFNFIKTFMRYDNKFVNFMYRYGSIMLLFVLITPYFDIAYSFLTSGILQGFFAFWGLFI